MTTKSENVELDFDELRRLYAAATQGRIFFTHDGNDARICLSGGNGVHGDWCDECLVFAEHPADGELLAALWNALPALLDRLEALTAERERAEQLRHRMRLLLLDTRDRLEQSLEAVESGLPSVEEAVRSPGEALLKSEGN